MFDIPFLLLINAIINSLWYSEFCELNKKVLGALEKSIGFYERNYSLFDFNGLSTFRYLKCIVFHFHFYLILSYNFIFYFNIFI